jgi:hypothetical protein
MWWGWESLAAVFPKIASFITDPDCWLVMSYMQLE